ncbi:Protein ROOT INITIATION DEFECTIVE 3 [Linum grandiflorum]
MSPSSPDIILTSSPDGPITAYDSFSGAVVARFTGSRSPRHGLTLLGNTFIAATHISSSSTGSTALHLYNWWSSTALHRLLLPEPVAPLAAFPDCSSASSYIFAGGLSGNIHSLSIPSGNLLGSFSAHRGSPVSCLEISPDWSLLTSGGDDGTIAVFPIFQLLDDDNRPENTDDIIIRRFTAHEGPVTSIVRCMGVSQPTVASCSMDSTCKLWNLLEGTNLRTVVFPCPISGMALDPSETDFYAAGTDGVVYRGGSRKRSGGQLVVALPGKHCAGIVSIALVDGGKRLVSAAEDGSVHVSDVEKGEVTMVMGNNTLESISEMVVAKGFAERRHNMGLTQSSSSSGLPGKQLCSRLGKETREREDELEKSVKDDRNNAIDMLESAIEVYEGLVDLILKEANRKRKGIFSNRLLQRM